MPSDTIYALATGKARAALAVVRVSGPDAGAVLQGLSNRPLPAERSSVLRKLTDPGTGELIDEALCLWFVGPRSFTGEDTVEFHVHGGRAVADALLGAISRFDGCRPAESGEFTRQAFENGRLDLTEAEAVNDLIEAKTRSQRLQSLYQLSGALGSLYEDWRFRLIEALAMTEADLDFPDEDLPEGVTSDVLPQIRKLMEEIRGQLKDGERGQKVRDGFRICILGAPNVGKSSILNRLAQREAAIVSEQAGTTRDVIEVEMDLAGFDVILSDTAGLRDALDAVEREGVSRAHRQAESADLRLFVSDGDPPPGLGDYWREGDVLVRNKCDLSESEGPADHLERKESLKLSALTGEGFDGLVALLSDIVSDRCGGSETVAITRVRHRRALEAVDAALTRYIGGSHTDHVLGAEDLRMAARALGEVTGVVDVDEILDVVFSSFCIGK